MPERRDRERGVLQKLLTSQARAWGKLSLAQNFVSRLEQELEAAHDRLHRADVRLAKLERVGFTRLRATLRGVLPDLLEAESRQAADALSDVETLEMRLEEARKERDRLERHLARLRSTEASFSEQALERARATLQEAPAEGDRPRRLDDQVLLVGHDLEDLEEADEALAAVSTALETARSALGSIPSPGFLSVISGLAILDLFETNEVRTAREALRQAKDAGGRAEKALRSLQMLSCPASCLELLQELEDHRFLDFLYHEGRLARVLTRAREAVEDFRSRTWSARNRLHGLKDGLLVKLSELESRVSPGDSVPPEQDDGG